MRVRLLPVVLTLLAACGTIRPPLSPDVPSPIAIYVPTSGPVADPALAIDAGGTLYAAWWGKGFGEIFLSRSDDRGATWSSPLNVSNTPLGSDFPVLAAGEDGALWLVWEELSITPTGGEIVFAISRDRGVTWSPTTNLSNTRASSSRPAITVGASGRVVVAWLEGEDQVLFTRSEDGGASWSPPADIAAGRPPNRTRAPALVQSGQGTLWAAWSVPNGEPVLARSDDGGRTWPAPIAMTATQPTSAPALVVDQGGELYAAWSQSSGLYSDIVVARIPDGNPVEVSHSPDVASVDPVLAVDRRGGLVCVWHEVIAGDTEVFMARSTDGGRTFSPPRNVSRTPGNSVVPQLVVDSSGTAYVVWEQGVKQAIFFVRVP